MNAERKDQPSKVSTQEDERPTDEHVVTSDLPTDVIAPAPTDQNDKTAAPGDTKPAGQTTEKPAASDDKSKKPTGPRDRPAERTIIKLKKQIATLEGERNSDRGLIENLQAQIDDIKTATPATPEPQLKDFDSPVEYAKAFGKWEAGNKPADDAGAAKPAARDPNAHATHDYPGKTAPDDEILDFHTKGKEKLGDEFTQALAKKGTAVDNDMGEFLLDSEFGAEIYIHLANNQDEARKIFDSGAVRKVRALEELEVKAKANELDVDSMQEALDAAANEDEIPGVTKPKEPEKKPTTDAVQTKAADPPSDTREAGTTTVKKDPNDESMDEYATRRNKEELEKRGIYK